MTTNPQHAAESNTDPAYVDEALALFETPEREAPPADPSRPAPRGLYDLPIFGWAWQGDGADLGA